MDVKGDNPPGQVGRRRLFDLGLKTSALLGLGLGRTGFGKKLAEGAVSVLGQSPHVVPFIGDAVFRQGDPGKTSPEVDSPEQKRLKAELAEKIVSWVLPDKAKIVDILPLARESAEVYKSGNIGAYMPEAKKPLLLHYDAAEKNGRLSFRPIWDNDSKVKIRAISPNIPPFEMPVYSTVELVVVLPLQVRGLYAERVLGIKEASQLIDYNEYAKTYVKILTEQGARFEVINPENRPLTTEFVTSSIALAQNVIELEKRGVAWFSDFVDFGSFLRVGGLAFIDWYLSYIQEHNKVPKEFLEGGHQSAGYLQQATKLLVFEGNHARWRAGRPPDIGSTDFMEHFNKFTGR